MVKTLVPAAVKTNVFSKKDMSLLAACQEGDLKTIKRLVIEENVSLHGLKGRPLELAILKGGLPTVKLLLELGGNLFEPTRNATTLEMACEQDDDVFYFVLDKWLDEEYDETFSKAFTLAHRCLILRPENLEVLDSLFIPLGVFPLFSRQEMKTLVGVACKMGRFKELQFIEKKFKLTKHKFPLFDPEDMNSSLELACHAGSLETLQFLEDKYRVSRSQVSYRRLLCISAQAKRGCPEEVVTHLLCQAAEVNGSLEYNPLLSAVMSERPTIVSLLLTAGADVDFMDPKHGMRPVHHAVMHNNGTEVLRALMQGGEKPADVNALSRGGFSALFLAAQEGKIDKAKMLIAGAPELGLGKSPGALLNLESGGHTPLCIAIEKGDLRMMKLLLRAGARNTKCSFLHALSEKEKKIQTDVMAILRSLQLHIGECCVTVPSDPSSQLPKLKTQFAIRRCVVAGFGPNDTVLVKFVQQKKQQDQQKKEEKKMMMMMKKEEEGEGEGEELREEHVRDDEANPSLMVPRHLLLRACSECYKTDPESKDQSILAPCPEGCMMASWCSTACREAAGKNGHALFCLPAKRELDKKHNDAMHSLFDAIERLDVAGVKDALNQGIDVNRRDAETNRSPLMVWAANTGKGEWDKSDDVYRSLHYAGAAIDAVDSQGMSPLHLAVRNGNYRAMRMLCVDGANPNLSCDQGETPLFAAGRRGDKDVLLTRLLLQYGSDPFHANNANQTAFQVVASISAAGDNAQVMALLSAAEWRNRRIVVGCTVSFAEDGKNVVGKVIKRIKDKVTLSDVSGKASLKNGHEFIINADVCSLACSKCALPKRLNPIRRRCPRCCIAAYCSADCLSADKSDHDEVCSQLIDDMEEMNEVFVAAAETGDTEILEHLLEEMVDPNRCWKIQEPALVAASKSTRDDAVRLLAASQLVDVDAVDVMGRTALHFAATLEYVEIARTLLSAGASPLAKCFGGLDPAFHARERKVKVSNLIDAAAKTNTAASTGNFCVLVGLNNQLYNNRCCVVDQKFSTGVDRFQVSLTGDEAKTITVKPENLQLACSGCYVGISVASPLKCPHCLAVNYCSSSCRANLAVKHKDTCKPLHGGAVSDVKCGSLGKILSTGEKKNLSTLFIISIQENELKRAEKFLLDGADVDFRFPSHSTEEGELQIDRALGIAIHEKNIEAVNLLLRFKADVNTPFGDNGFTPLFLAIHLELVDVVAALVRAKADVNGLVDPSGEGTDFFSPLHMSIEITRTDILEILIKSRDCDINVRTGIQGIQGITPLILAALRNNLKAVQVLLRQGARTDLVLNDNNRATALEVARQHKHWDIVDAISNFTQTKKA